jgi:hypothetical protein
VTRAAMIRCLPGIAIAAASLTVAAQTFAQVYIVPPELWDRPRSGRAVLESPAVRQAVDAFLTQPAARLVVHHGNGQESLLFAEELRSWLAALAIEPARILLRADLKPTEPLRLEVMIEERR